MIFKDSKIDTVTHKNPPKPHDYPDIQTAIEHLIRVNRSISKKMSLHYTFLRGIFSALGSTLGLLVVLSVVIYLLKLFGIFDYFEPFLQSLQNLVKP